MTAALSALVEIICVERIANALSMVLYIYACRYWYSKSMQSCNDILDCQLYIKGRGYSDQSGYSGNYKIHRT